MKNTLAWRLKSELPSLPWVLNWLVNTQAPTLSVFKYPDGIEDAAFRSKLAVKGVIVASALAELQGKAFRMGHMGSVTEDELLVALKRMLEVCQELGVKVDKGQALNAFLEA